MDALKKTIAEYAAAALRGEGAFFRWPDLPIEEIRYVSETPLETVIQVKTTDQGTRYFKMKVSEL